jgi:hypothetical protein
LPRVEAAGLAFPALLRSRMRQQGGRYTSRVKPLYSSEDLRIDAFLNGSDTVVYTFSPWGFTRLQNKGFGTDFLVKHGFDVIAVRTTRNAWYENLTHDLLLMLRRSGRKYDRRCAYGSSMGGFAAIRFSRILDVQRAFAISPQFDIRYPWDTRWEKEGGLLKPEPLMRASYVNHDLRAIIAFDPANADARHAALYRKMIRNVEEVRVRHSGHPAGYHLNSIGALGKVALHLFRDEERPDVIALHRSKRANSARYLTVLARECMSRRHYSAAKWVAALAVEADPQSRHAQAAHDRALRVD